MSRIQEMKERIKAHQGNKQDWEIVRNANISRALQGNSNKRGSKSPHTEQAKAKIKENHAKHWEGKKRPDIAKYVKPGKDHPAYGSGRLYIEHTTGFIGTAHDMANQFEQDEGTLIFYAKRGTPMKRGKFKGLHFDIYKP